VVLSCFVHVHLLNHLILTVASCFLGRAQSSATGVSVSLTVGTASSECTAFTVYNPSGTCTLTVNPTLFTSSGTSLSVSLSLSVSSVVVQNQRLSNVMLAAAPTPSIPSAVGIYFQMPIYTAVPGSAQFLEAAS
jgi:hypothetical protein